MFTCPDNEEEFAGSKGELNDQHLSDITGGRTPIHRIMRDNAEPIELTDDELEDIAGGLMVEADESAGASHDPPPE